MKKIQNEKWINALPDAAVSIAEEINIEIAKIIAERIKSIGELSPSDVKKLTNSLEYLGADFGKITKLIAEYSGKGQQAVVDILHQVADANDDFAKTFYSAKGIAAHTWHNDTYLNELVEAITRQTAAEFTNLSQTLAYKINDRTIPLRQMYTRAIDKAIYEVQSGTVDYHTAMRKTVKQLATGLRVSDPEMTVDKKTGEVKLKWDSGYSRRIDSHIRQNTIDGVKQLQAQMLDYHGERFGSDGVEISTHAISAPDHLPVQGRQFSNEEFYKLQTGQDFEDVKGNEYKGFSRPIGQWNCRHVKFPIIIGISEPVHTEEQLKEFADNSAEKYGLTQQQRAMETKLRSLKTQRLAASAAGDELEAKRIQLKINEQQTIYRRFSEKHGLLYDTKRASVEGYKRISVKDITPKEVQPKAKTMSKHYDTLQTDEQKRKFVQESTGVSYEEAELQYGSIARFGGMDYTRIRRASYQGGSFAEETTFIGTKDVTYGQMADYIEKFIDNSPKWDGKIYRGINLPKQELEKIKVGSVVDMQGISSWTSNFEIAESYSFKNTKKTGNQKAIFHANGTKQGTSIKHLAHYDFEDEILVSKKAKWVITKIESKSDILHFFVDELEE